MSAKPEKLSLLSLLSLYQLRRLATWENLLIGCIVTGTAASVAMTAWIAAIVWRIPA